MGVESFSGQDISRAIGIRHLDGSTSENPTSAVTYEFFTRGEEETTRHCVVWFDGSQYPKMIAMGYGPFAIDGVSRCFAALQADGESPMPDRARIEDERRQRAETMMGQIAEELLEITNVSKNW